MTKFVTALKTQKRNKDRVNVYLNNHYALAVSRVVAATLQEGQYLDDATIEKLKNEDARNKAYNTALRFLSFRPRTETEIVRHLRKKGYTPDILTQVIARLVDERYLDDEAFVRSWVDARERLRPRSRYALRYELRQKGVSDDIIESVLADVREDVSAWAAVENKLHRWRALSRKDFKKKVMNFLDRRGFSYEASRAVHIRAWSMLHQPSQEMQEERGATRESGMSDGSGAEEP